MKKLFILLIFFFCSNYLFAQEHKAPFYNFGIGTSFHIAKPTDIDPKTYVNTGLNVSIGGGYSFNKILALGADISGAYIKSTNFHYEEIGIVPYYPIYGGPKILINCLSSTGLNLAFGPVYSRYATVTSKGWGGGLGYNNHGNLKINLNFMTDEKDKFFLNLGITFFKY